MEADGEVGSPFQHAIDHGGEDSVTDQDRREESNERECRPTEGRVVGAGPDHTAELLVREIRFVVEPLWDGEIRLTSRAKVPLNEWSAEILDGPVLGVHDARVLQFGEVDVVE